jgi:hypothetical protein
MVSDTMRVKLHAILCEALTKRQVSNIASGFNINLTYADVERILEQNEIQNFSNCRHCGFTVNLKQPPPPEADPVAWEIYLKTGTFVTLTRDKDAVTRYTDRGFMSVPLYR